MDTKGPNAPQAIPVHDGAEAFVELLVNNGVEYIFINSGTDTYPILEAISRMNEQERIAPEVVLCLDENTAMSAAHGYWQATGHAQVVMVHVDAGTMAIGGAYHNAQRDHAAIVVCAGKAPLTIDSGMLGERDNYIHWTQEQRDQAGAVRTFTKWDYEIRWPAQLPDVVHKAFQVTSSEPTGPVYMMIPREVLMARMDSVLLPDSSRHSPPVSPAADHASIETLAHWLRRAERPVIMPGSFGRHPEAVDALVELAELVGAAVVTDRSRPRASFPSNHKLFAGMHPETLANADLVLVLDNDIPWVPGRGGPGPEATIAWIDIDASKETIPLWTFGVDLMIHASSDKAVDQLLRAIKEDKDREQFPRIAARTIATSNAIDARRQQAFQAIAQEQMRAPITPQYLAHCLNETIPSSSIVLAETVSSTGEVMTYLERTEPGSLFQSGGSSLGWAMGAAIGHKLAAPNSDVISLVGDGAFVFGCPTSALWGAEQYRAPFLTVIFNNSMHFATKRALQTWFPDGSSKRTGRWTGIDITPSPEYALLAQACRAYGERVDLPDQLIEALQRGIERIRDGQCAVIDVRIQRF